MGSRITKIELKSLVGVKQRTRSAYRLLNKLAHWDEELNDKIGMPDNTEEAVLVSLTFFASIAESAKVHVDSFTYSEDEK